jgi:hypothetical protein
MTDVMPEQTAAPEDWSDVEQSADGAAYPEAPDNPHNHRFTISFDGRGPMVVVRGNTAADVIAAYEELENHAVGAAMGNAWAALKASAVPAGAPALPQVPQGPAAPANFANPNGSMTPPPFGPNVSVPQAPGFQGGQGFQAPPQGGFGGGQAQGPRDNTPEFQQNGWYALTVPFPVGKKQFDGICQQYQLKKGRPAEGGTFSFNGTNKTWYVSPQVAGCFPMFNPMPA